METIFRKDTATAAQIEQHFRECDSLFDPQLSSYVEIADYAQKIFGKAARFEAWHNDSLAGLVACYFNNPDSGKGFVTSVSVAKNFQRSGVARKLMAEAIDFGRKAGFKTISLEVFAHNKAAIALYAAQGFAPEKVTMQLDLLSHCDIVDA